MYYIQEASLSAIPLIRELSFKVWPQTYAAILAPEQITYMLELMYSEASLTKQMKDGAQFILLYNEKEAVGFASYQQMHPHIFKLNKLYVLASEQGKGSGKLMINNIINRIALVAAKTLQLQVHKQNKAIFFYEKLGFVIIRDFITDIGEGFVMDDYIMEKQLVL